MIVGDLITWKVRDDAAVYAIVADRIYPLTDKEGTYPQIQYEVEAVEDALALHSGRSSLVRANVKLYLLTETYGESDTLLEAVITCLDRARGVWGGTEIDATDVIRCVAQDDLSEEAITDPETDDVHYIEKSLSFVLTYRRT